MPRPGKKNNRRAPQPRRPAQQQQRRSYPHEKVLVPATTEETIELRKPGSRATSREGVICPATTPAPAHLIPTGYYISVHLIGAPGVRLIWGTHEGRRITPGNVPNDWPGCRISVVNPSDEPFTLVADYKTYY